MHDSDSTGDELATRLLAPATFPHLVSDCKTLAASEIKTRGMRARTAFRVAQKLKPDILDRTVRELMPDFVHALEPCYADYRARYAAGGSDDLRAYLMAHEAEVAEAMLSAADRRAEKIYSRTIRSAYDRLRGRAYREIVAAMPEIAATIAKHA